ncbi:MAG: serine hydrolase domain-containing protein [Phycisphaerales bacterium]
MNQLLMASWTLLMCAPIGLADDGPSPDADETPSVVAGDRGREMDELLTGCAEWNFSGSVLVVRDDEVILRNGYGLANRENGTPNTPDTLFEIASVTKHFTAAAVLHLEEAGRLSTDDPIAKWLPAVPDEHAGVTIHHLLAHTSGFPRMGPTGRGHDASAALRDYLSGGRVNEPGAAFGYWNGGYALLAMIIERASGQSYQAYCRNHLFEPAGMRDTGFCQDSTFPERRVAHGYDEGRDVGVASAHSYGWEYRGMGGIVTSVADFERWDRALRAGRVLQLTEKLETPGASGYAGGGWVERTPRDTTQIMLGGNVTGFNSSVWRLPDDRALVVVLCNTPSNAFIVGMHLSRRLFDQPGMLAMPPKQMVPDEHALAALRGSYRSADGSILKLRPDAGAVRVAVEGQPAVQMLLYGDPTIPDGVQQTIDAAEALLRGVIDGDYARFRAAMADGIPDDWPDRFRGYWQSHVKNRGAIESVELIGALPTSRSPSSLKTMFRLRQAQGDTVVELLFDAGRLHVFELEAHGPAYEFRYVPTSRSTLETYRLVPGSPPVVELDQATGDLVVRGSRGAALAFTRRRDGSSPRR